MYVIPKQIAWTGAASGHVITGPESPPMSNSNAMNMSQVYCSEEPVSHWMQCVMVRRTVLMARMNGTARLQAAQIISSVVIGNVIFIRCGATGGCNVLMVRMRLNAIISLVKLV